MNLQPYTSSICQTLYAALSDSPRNEEIQALLAKLDGLSKLKEEMKETDQLQGKAFYLRLLTLDDLRVAALNKSFCFTFLNEFYLMSADSIISRHLQRPCEDVLKEAASKVLKTVSLSTFYKEATARKPFHRSLTWIALAPHAEVSKVTMKELEEFNRPALVPLQAKLKENPIDLNANLKELSLKLPWRLFQTFYIPVGRIPLLTTREIVDYTPYLTSFACSLLTEDQLDACIKDPAWSFSFDKEQSKGILQINLDTSATKKRWKLFYEGGRFQEVVKKLSDTEAFKCLRTIPAEYYPNFPLSYLNSSAQKEIFDGKSNVVHQLSIEELHSCAKKRSISSQVLVNLSDAQIKELDYTNFGSSRIPTIFFLWKSHLQEESKRRIALLSSESILKIVVELRKERFYGSDSDHEYGTPNTKCHPPLSTFLGRLSKEQINQLDMNKLQIAKIGATFSSIHLPAVEDVQKAIERASHPSEKIESIHKAIEALEQSKKEAYDRLEMLPLETLHQIFSRLPDSIKIIYVERYLKRIKETQVHVDDKMIIKDF